MCVCARVKCIVVYFIDCVKVFWETRLSRDGHIFTTGVISVSWCMLPFSEFGLHMCLRVGVGLCVCICAQGEHHIAWSEPAASPVGLKFACFPPICNHTAKIKTTANTGRQSAASAGTFSCSQLRSCVMRHSSSDVGRPGWNVLLLASEAHVLVLAEAAEAGLKENDQKGNEREKKVCSADEKKAG